MSVLSARLSLVFSCIGHTFSHLFAPIFFVVVLALEDEWALTHGEAVGLVVVGNVLFGVAAPFAGWLGDRWRATGMMGLYFAGTGLGMVATGLAAGPFWAALALALTGLFASIYHPVGISWLVRNSVNRGTALGINGIFGAIGPAVAALLAGGLTDLFGWRWAFLAPGLLMLATAAVFSLLLARGVIVESEHDMRTDPPTSNRERLHAFGVLTVTMLCTGLIYQATQAGLPKVFSERVGSLGGNGVFGVSLAVAAVYFVAGGLQVVAGRLADRYPLKLIYLGTFLLQAPMLYLAAVLAGEGLVIAAMVMVSANVGALPAENTLIARYAPSRWRGLVFGMKFILAFGVSGLGVKLEGVVYDLTGGFFWLFALLAGLALAGALAGLMLPRERRAAATP